MIKLKNHQVQKSISYKKKLKFQDYKNCSNAGKIDEKTKYLKKKNNVDILKRFVNLTTTRIHKVKGIMFLMK